MGKKNRNTRGPPLTVDVMPPQGKTSSTSVTPATSGTSVKASDGTKEKEGALSVAEVPESESCMVRLMCKATDEVSFVGIDSVPIEVRFIILKFFVPELFQNLRAGLE